MLLTLFTVAFTSTVPTSYDGATTVQVVVDVQLTLRARAAGIFAFLNLKVVAVVPTANPVPLTVTLVPPAVGPVLGLTLVTVGANLK